MLACTGSATMAMPIDVLKSRRADILRLASHYGAHHVRVFGSAARGTAGPASDIDLLVRMDRGRSLLDLIELTQELESILQCKVDVLTDEGLSPYLKDRIQAEAIPL